MARRRWRDLDEWAMPHTHRSHSNGKWSVLGVGVIIIFGLGAWCGASFFAPVNNYTTAPGASPTNSSSTPNADNQLPPKFSTSNTVTHIYEETHNSIFTISAQQSSGSKDGTQLAIGTGFLIDQRGDIATNAHVVGNAKKVAVTVGNKTYPGDVLGADPLDDLALVHIDAPSTLQPLHLGTAKNLVPGQMVVAIGNPFELTSSVSAGIVSGVNRSVPEAQGHVMDGLIQTDAALNPGNSGGPLLNQNGQVVGINTMIESPVEGSVGVGFAIPIDRLIQLENQLMKGSTVEHPWVGIEGLGVDSTLQQALKLPASNGVYVTVVTPGSPAAKAGLHGDSGGSKAMQQQDLTYLKGDGDVIVGVNGHSLQSFDDMTSIINQLSPGTKITLSIVRDGKPMTVPLTLGNWPSTSSSQNG